MGTVKIWLDSPEIKNILKNNQSLQKTEKEYMDQVLNNVKAQILVEFGAEGNFIISKRDTGSRTAFSIRGNDARTNAILKANQGWLAKFL